jgi:penicillin-binding protein 3
MSLQFRCRVRFLPAISAFLLVVLSFSSALFLAGCSTPILPTGSVTTGSQGEATATSGIAVQNKPLDVFNQYSQAWSGQDYAAMYRLLSSAAKARVGEDVFIDRYKKIIQGIEASNVRVSMSGNVTENSAAGLAAIEFAVGMDTLAGSILISGYTMNLILETIGEQVVWTIDWSEKMIFPHMDPTDKVRARIIPPARGEIRDRNHVGLAVNGDLIVIGVVPGKFDAVKAEAIPQMAAILGISTARIEKALINATNPDWFYPVVTLPADAKDLSAQLTAIAGVQYQKASGRIYPAGAAAGLLTGYVGPITAEELAKHPGEAYSVNDKIGKMGLEQVYEKRLRGQAGGEIYLTAADSSAVKERLGYLDPVDGEDITLTIDSKVQHSLYNQMKGDAGAAAAIHPKTGEILALVSTPSFDPNLLQTFVPDTVQAEWNAAAVSPFTNRFKAGYPPGSVFKLVTAAIGLRAKTLDPAEALPISGLQWQPNTSWGNYKVTRVKDIGRPVNMRDAFLYSDNIYFAQQALRIGADLYTQGAAGFGIGEDLPIDYPFFRSQVANENLQNQVLLADTGYGQGQVLVSPLHVALFYTVLANNGDMMKPILEITAGQQPQVWKAQAVDPANVPLLTETLVQVIENPAGTGYTATPAKTRMLGKTGTAELGLPDDPEKENGWFVAMNVDSPRLCIAMMIERVQDRGGSHYVVPLVKRAMDELMLLLPAT